MAVIKKSKPEQVDYVILGAGIFGLYAASILAKKKKSTLVLESGMKSFSRASAINQARIHNGYHYPRSVETASKAAHYYERFITDFKCGVTESFEQIYAVAKEGSKTSADEYIEFCRLVGIPLRKIPSSRYFRRGVVEAAFITKECGFDFNKIRDQLLNQIQKPKSVTILYDTVVESVAIKGKKYELKITGGKILRTPVVINATYASINDVIKQFNADIFDLKYELCEVALCKVPESFKRVGITVMDGDFFSLMPFADQKYHSLTSVGYTPHYVSYDETPKFLFKDRKKRCFQHNTKQCMICAQPVRSAWDEMYGLVRWFLKDEFQVQYKQSLFEIKPILKISEADDSRPTIIRKHRDNPAFISVLSGKLSGIYDLEEIL